MARRRRRRSAPIDRRGARAVATTAGPVGIGVAARDQLTTLQVPDLRTKVGLELVARQLALARHACERRLVVLVLKSERRLWLANFWGQLTLYPRGVDGELDCGSEAARVPNCGRKGEQWALVRVRFTSTPESKKAS